MVFRKLFEYWAVASVLSDGIAQRLALFTALLLVPVRRRLFGRHPIRLSLHVSGRTVEFFIRDGADTSTLREIFVEREYEVDLGREPKRIADIGAHIGTASLFFACTYPQARIRSYEPDPDNYAVLVMNTKQFPNIVTSNMALSDTAGSVRFFRNTVSSIGSSTIRRRDTEEIAVVSTTLDTILRDGLDLIKFDIEGAEYNMLAAATDIKKCHAYVGELHYDLTRKILADFKRVFAGFRLKKLREITASRAIAYFELLP